MRLITRTDWPLAKRIMAPTTGRLRHLRLTSRLCELAISAELDFADHVQLLRIAAAHARGLPQTVVKHGEFEPEAWYHLARNLIEELYREDEQARVSTAARLARVPNFNLLYGVPQNEVGEV
jgi:hypothetical protein